jgi:NADPH:quinone reductase-like Zn-dependent oxidoreductase
MSGQQKALWLEKAQGKFVVSSKHIDKPGHGELLVKIEATALNPVSFLVIATRTSAHNMIQVEWKVQKYDYMIKVSRHTALRAI